MNAYVGIDLAWKDTNRTGLAAVDGTGRLVSSGALKSDDDLAEWLTKYAPKPTVVAVDAPLIVPNATGQRLGEKLIGQSYGRYGASAYPANRGNPLFNPPRAERLAQRFGWEVDPASPIGDSRTVCIEVYPHPALVGLFALPQRVLYKKGANRRAGFLELAALLESVPELRLADSGRWAELLAVIADPAPGDLTRIEDELDAILCAYLAWLWHHRPETLTVFGTLEDGYIVAPPSPTHPALLTPSLKVASNDLTIEVWGVEPGTIATARGDRWKSALLAESAGIATFEPGKRLELEVDFVVPVAANHNDQWDLDNLLKSTMDALIGPLGARPVVGQMPQADDERIDRIVATKSTLVEGGSVGARMVLRRLG